MASRKRQWDAPREHNWDKSSADGSSDESEDPEAQRLDACRELAEMLIALRAAGKLASSHVCILAHWAFLAGAQSEDLEAMKLRPDAASGDYQARLDKAMGFDSDSRRLMTLPIPGHTPYDMCRTVHSVRVSPVHEALAA